MNSCVHFSIKIYWTERSFQQFIYAVNHHTPTQLSRKAVEDLRDRRDFLAAVLSYVIEYVIVYECVTNFPILYTVAGGRTM